ncbi:MAG TPA: tetratricopeptide repeat protein [Dehalococcoidia bacterium]|nr:tetratricopeptide repeat protein [Dehalococcoidia bacterium]
MTAFDDTLGRFRAAVAGPMSLVPLARPALLIAQAEYPGLDVEAYEERLHDLGAHLEARIHPSADVRTQLAEAHRLLFEEYGFHGNEDEYGDPKNLYLNDVMERRTGIPVTLAILYVEVCRTAGLDAHAVGLPGHVIVRVDSPEASVLVDPFNAGSELTEEQCRQLVRGVFGRRTPFREHFLEPVTSRQVTQRLLHNLKAGYLQRGDEERAGRAIEFLLALFPWDLDEVRDRGMLRERVGDLPAALADLEEYVRYRAGARDIQTVNEAVRSLRRQTGAAER